MQQNKVFKTGILVGRFQHIHAGHERLINIGLSLCDKLLVFIGSAHCEITARNPFDYEYRKSLIEKIYDEEVKAKRVIVQPLDDFEDSSELSIRWGHYVLDSATAIFGQKAECIIYGKDKDIFKCFEKEVVKNITEILVDRHNFEISATKIREYILDDNYEQWKKYTNEKIHDEYSKIRNRIQNVTHMK